MTDGVAFGRFQASPTQAGPHCCYQLAQEAVKPKPERGPGTGFLHHVSAYAVDEFSPLNRSLFQLLQEEDEGFVIFRGW